MRYHKNPDLASRVMVNEAYIVVPETNMMYILNEPGAVLWSRLSEPASEEELTDALCGVFEVHHTEAQKDVMDFLDEMMKADLLKVVGN